MDSCITLVYPMDVPVVFDNHLEDNPGIECGSEPWFYWLDQPEVKSFNYNLGLGVRFLARKRLNKDGSALWSAHKKVGGEMRVLGLGRTENLTPENLSAIAQALTNLDKDAWNEFKANRTTAKAPGVSCTTAAKCITSDCTAGENGTPYAVVGQYPSDLGRRVVELERRIAELDAIKRCFNLNQAKNIARRLVKLNYGKNQAEVLARFISELCWIDIAPEELEGQEE